MQSVLTPFLLAIFAAYLVNPLIAYFEHKGFKRKAVVILFYLTLCVIFVAALGVFIPRAADQIQDLGANWHERVRDLRKLTLEFEATGAKYMPGGQDLVQMLDRKMLEAGAKLAGILPGLASGLFSLFSLIFLVPIIAFFFLIEGPRMEEWALSVCQAAT